MRKYFMLFHTCWTIGFLFSVSLGFYIQNQLKISSLKKNNKINLKNSFKSHFIWHFFLLTPLYTYIYV